MRGRHVLLVVLVAAVWGLNFVVVRIGLGSFPPLLLVALRFAFAAIPAIFVPRPNVSWTRMIAIAATLFVGQFGFLFTGMAMGMPAGLASAVTQMQAFFTIGLAATFLGERANGRQIGGTCVALAGLALIVSSTGREGLSAIGLELTLSGAVSWAIGNVLLRGAGKVDMFAMVVWTSLLPPAPLLVLSLLADRPTSIESALGGVGWSGIVSVGYLALVATVGGYGLWGHLLKLYPASLVAPVALLVPLFGMAFAFAILGETFGLPRLAGTGLIVLGLAVFVRLTAFRRGIFNTRG
jgi:O-acetylserine/cysteine efflux transporter